MKKLIPSLLAMLFLVGVICFWIFGKENDYSKITAVVGEAEFYEENINFVFDGSNQPVLLETVNEDESKIFIEKIQEVNLNPENILKAGNELFFTSGIKKEEEVGIALFTYDVIMRKFKELYFYKQEESNPNVKFVLKAIDVVGNKLVLILQDRGVSCGSLWLEQGDNFYTYNLLDNGKDGLVKYSVPEWKIEEESQKEFECVAEDL